MDEAESKINKSKNNINKNNIGRTLYNNKYKRYRFDVSASNNSENIVIEIEFI
jgi:hypothetical protein